MVVKCVKSLLVAVFSLSLVFVSSPLFAQGGEPKEPVKEKKLFDANEVIFGHIMDAHEFHFLSYKDSKGEEHSVSIPLPVMIYSKEKGFACFMSSKFEEGKETYKGYGILTNEKIDELNLDRNKYTSGMIVAVNDAGKIDQAATVYDFSPTRNVVQMLLALTLLVVILIR